jgi:hypothetical protein
MAEEMFKQTSNKEHKSIRNNSVMLTKLICMTAKEKVKSYTGYILCNRAAR